MRPAFEGRLGFARGDERAPRELAIGRLGPLRLAAAATRSNEAWAVALDFNVRRRPHRRRRRVLRRRQRASRSAAASRSGGRASGGWAEGRVRARPSRRTLTGGFGRDRPARRARPRAPPDNRTLFGSAIVQLTPELAASLEYRWMQTRLGRCRSRARTITSTRSSRSSSDAAAHRSARWSGVALAAAVRCGWPLALTPALARADAVAGTIETRVRAGRVCSDPGRLRRTPRRADAGAARHVHGSRRRTRLRRRACSPCPVGSTVSFPNEDPIFHNVFSLSTPQPFDLGLYRSGASKTRTFTAAGGVPRVLQHPPADGRVPRRRAVAVGHDRRRRRHLALTCRPAAIGSPRSPSARRRSPSRSPSGRHDQAPPIALDESVAVVDAAPEQVRQAVPEGGVQGQMTGSDGPLGLPDQSPDRLGLA